MSVSASSFADSYLSWLTKNVVTAELQDGITELTTPFLDRHNDHLQIYAERREADLFCLTDDGYILAELKASGLERRGRRREELFAQIVRGYGVHLERDRLQIEATSANIGRRAHSLVQAMLSLDDMFVLAQPRVSALFSEDVAKFLDDNDVRFSPRVKLAGKSGLDHLIDFVIPKSRNAPERVVQAVNLPRRDRIESLLFAATDTRGTRGSAVSYLAIVNDSRGDVPADFISAFAAYDVNVYRWSQREEVVEVLAA